MSVKLAGSVLEIVFLGDEDGHPVLDSCVTSVTKDRLI